MAFTTDDAALLKNPNDPNSLQSGQSPQGLGGQGAIPNTGGSGQDPFASTGGVSTAGVGAGGTGGWTNIQAYLNANQGNSGSADALNKQVGSAFDQEDQTFKDQSAQTRQKAQDEIDRSNMGQDQASKLISDASGLYQYGGQKQAPTSSGQDPYQSIIDQFNTTRKAYSGPSQFNYQTSAPVQDYGANLGNDQGFGALMQGVYNKSAGGQMNSGQQALQSQLDSNSQPLQQARQSLLNRYSGLSGAITQGSQDTNQFIQNAQSQVDANKSALDQYLGDAGTQYRTQLDRKVDLVNKQMNAETAALDRGVNQKWGTNGIGEMNSFVANPTQTASESNLGGEDQQRNGWNVIQDIFNRPEQKIDGPQYGKPFDPGQPTFNWGNSYSGESGKINLQDLLNDPRWQGLSDPVALTHFQSPQSF